MSDPAGSVLARVSVVIGREILGVDASLTSTGVALISGESVTTAAICSTGKRGDLLPARVARLNAMLAGVRPWVRPGALVVIEGPAFGAPGGSTWDRAGLWHRLVAMFYELDCEVAIVGNSTRAKWATGSGKSDKAGVAVAVSRLVPDVNVPTSDEADALVLALMGAQALGSRPQTKARAESTAKGVWPESVNAGLVERLTLRPGLAFTAA